MGKAIIEPSVDELYSQMIKLNELAVIKIVNKGTKFDLCENAIYIPLAGYSHVLTCQNDMVEHDNYAQAIINNLSFAGFVANFLNSDYGKKLRYSYKDGVINSKPNIKDLSEIPISIPSLVDQKLLLGIDTNISEKKTNLLVILNELEEMRRKVWAEPSTILDEAKKLDDLELNSNTKHSDESIEKWIERLPFPLASILRKWFATNEKDLKNRHDHLLHFFEATAEFIGVIFLSAYSNFDRFDDCKKGLKNAMKNQNLVFERATFGTWKCVVEYFGKQTRILLSENGKDQAKIDRDKETLRVLFSDIKLAKVLSHTKITDILSATNKMRNDWTGHGGVVGDEEVINRNQQLNLKLQELRTEFEDIWEKFELIQCKGSQKKKHDYHNDVDILNGSNSTFINSSKTMDDCLDVEELYIVGKNSRSALKLLPFLKLGSSPSTVKNAFYFFNKIEKNGARYISYHFENASELIISSTDIEETIKLLTE